MEQLKQLDVQASSNCINNDDPPFLQLLTAPFDPGSLQTFLAVDQHTPPLVAATSIAGNDRVEVTFGEFQHFSIKRPRLQPHRGDPDGMRFL